MLYYHMYFNPIFMVMFIELIMFIVLCVFVILFVDILHYLYTYNTMHNTYS